MSTFKHTFCTGTFSIKIFPTTERIASIRLATHNAISGCGGRKGGT